MNKLTASEILDGLKSISEDYSLISIYWHIMIYLAIVLLLFAKWRPSNRMAAMFLSLPFITVAVLAWESGNPFNGTLYSVLTFFCLLIGFRLSEERVQYSSIIYRIAGFLLLLFGLWYPHFIEPDNFIIYLYEAPSGLIPCPTLSVAIGMALIYNGFNSNPMKIILICYGLFYGLFGLLKLGVYLDIVLLVGTIIFTIQSFMNRKPVLICELF